MNALVRDLYCAYMLPGKRNLGGPYSILWGPKSDAGKEATSKFEYVWMKGNDCTHATWDPFYRIVFQFLASKILGGK